MSKVWSGIDSASGLGRHIPGPVPVWDGRPGAYAHGGRANQIGLRERGPQLDSAVSPAAAQETPTVFVVDDDVSVRESLELLLRFEGWRPEVFASAQAFLARPRALTPSCLVLDISLPDRSGLDLQRLVADRTDMPVIFITGHGDVPVAVRAMKAGAVEFLTKPLDDEALLAAVRYAIGLSRAALSRESKLRALRDSYASLTLRERQVMELVAAGFLNKQVGLRLGISEITVKAHRGRVMQKMGADSLADLVRIVGRLGVAAA